MSARLRAALAALKDDERVVHRAADRAFRRIDMLHELPGLGPRAFPVQRALARVGGALDDFTGALDVALDVGALARDLPPDDEALELALAATRQVVGRWAPSLDEAVEASKKLQRLARRAAVDGRDERLQALLEEVTAAAATTEREVRHGADALRRLVLVVKDRWPAGARPEAELQRRLDDLLAARDDAP